MPPRDRLRQGIQLRRIFRRHWVSPLLGLALFGLCVTLLMHQLRRYSLVSLWSDIQTIPPTAIGMAIALMGLNYWVLSGYDALALRYLGISLGYGRLALCSLTAFSVSNTVGCALLSGSAVRYRFYRRWGLPVGQIAQVIAFTNLTFWLGLLGVSAALFTLTPLPLPPPVAKQVAKALPLAVTALVPANWPPLLSLGPLCAIAIAAYVIWSARSHQALRLWGLCIPPLPLTIALRQLLISALDWALAAGILYVLLPPHQIPYGRFLGVYLLGQLLGLLSNVPGGIGVFETVLLWFLTPALTPTALLGGLLVFRGIYYLLPLTLALLFWGFYEARTLNTLPPNPHYSEPMEITVKVPLPGERDLG